MRCRTSPAQRGFTITEILVVTGVVGLLIALIAPAMSAVKANGRLSLEKSAGHQLMLAYIAYAAANNDFVLPGYADRIPADSANPNNGKILRAYDARGRSIEGPGPPPLDVARRRYVWRLAPYLSYNLRGLYVNQQEELLERLEGQDHNAYLYAASVSPSLGLNTMWVGGDSTMSGFLPPTHPLRNVLDLDHYYLRSTAEVVHGDMLMVFCSARGVDPESSGGGGGKPVEGYYRVTSPYFHEMVGYQWSPTFEQNGDPATYGFISPRHKGLAVTAFLDGHVGTLSAEDLKDMRYWANWATRPDWRLTRLGH